MVEWLSTFVFHFANRVQIMGGAVKFEIANLYIKGALRQ